MCRKTSKQTKQKTLYLTLTHISTESKKLQEGNAGPLIRFLKCRPETKWQTIDNKEDVAEIRRQESENLISPQGNHSNILHVLLYPFLQLLAVSSYVLVQQESSGTAD